MPERSSEPKRAPDFRYIPCDSISMSFNDNGCRLRLGIEENPNDTLEQIGVYMSHKTTKMLATILTMVLEHYEQTTGETVTIDEEKVQALRARMGETNPVSGVSTDDEPQS